MASVFLSYAHATRAAVRAVVNGLEFEGWRVWWDARLKGGAAFAMEIERQLDDADHVVVAWSDPARRSVWVRGEALEALDAGKLVQIQLDKSRLPVPFNALHAIDFAQWDGTRNAEAWRSLEESLGDASTRPNAREGSAPASAPPVSAAERKAARPLDMPPLALADAVTGASVRAVVMSAIAAIGSVLAVAGVLAGVLSANLFVAATGFCFGASLLASAISARRMARTDTRRPRAPEA